jgi:hypothetical protein
MKTAAAKIILGWTTEADGVLNFPTGQKKIKWIQLKQQKKFGSSNLIASCSVIVGQSLSLQH